MKKIYLAPDTTIVKVEITNILAGSLSLDNDGGTGELVNEVGDGGVLSRGSSLWEGDEE